MTYRTLWFISRQNVSFIISNRDRVCMPNDNFVFTFARFFRTLLHYVRPVWLIINLSETRCDDWSFKIYYFQHTQSFSIHKFFSWVYNLRWDHMSTTTELLSRGNSQCSSSTIQQSAQEIKNQPRVMTGNAERLHVPIIHSRVISLLMPLANFKARFHQSHALKITDDDDWRCWSTQKSDLLRKIRKA